MTYLKKTSLDVVINDEDDSANKKDFQRVFSLTDETLPDYKFRQWSAPEMKSSLKTLINEFFPRIHASWINSITQDEILTAKNSTRKNNKHKSPSNAHISSTILIHFICDAVLGSYAVDTSESDNANLGYILYTFSPNVSPGRLIVMNPPHVTYLETANKFITRMNFIITDQDFSLIDLQGEQLQITLDVKS